MRQKTRGRGYDPSLPGNTLAPSSSPCLWARPSHLTAMTTPSSLCPPSLGSRPHFLRIISPPHLSFSFIYFSNSSFIHLPLPAKFVLSENKSYACHFVLHSIHLYYVVSESVNKWMNERNKDKNERSTFRAFSKADGWRFFL